MLMNPNSDYDFILNPEKPKKQPVDLMKNPKMLFAFLGFTVLIVIILAIVLNMLLSGSSNSQKENLTEIAKTQTEIIRVAELVEKNDSATEPTKYRALNAKLTTISAEKSVESMLQQRGAKKINTKILASGKDPSTDEELDKATKNNKFNETYNKVLDQQLETLSSQVQKAYDNANKSEKITLKKIYSDIEGLAKSQ